LARAILSGRVIRLTIFPPGLLRFARALLSPAIGCTRLLVEADAEDGGLGLLRREAAPVLRVKSGDTVEISDADHEQS